MPLVKWKEEWEHKMAVIKHGSFFTECGRKFSYVSFKRDGKNVLDVMYTNRHGDAFDFGVYTSMARLVETIEATKFIKDGENNEPRFPFNMKEKR